MKRNDSALSTTRGFRVALLIGTLLLLSFWLASITSVWLVYWLKDSGSVLESLILSRGPPKLMRRCLMVYILLFLPIILRRYTWGGWNDCGLNPDKNKHSFSPWWHDARNGLALGVISLGIMAVLTSSLGMRKLDPTFTTTALFFKLPYILVSALAVGLLEEILVRGILFRSLARLWGSIVAAGVTSMFFSLGHFLTPTPEAFTNGPTFKTSLEVLKSMFEQLSTHPFLALEIFNLTLMGLTLCAFVARKTTVWFVAGLHAGWVGVIRLNGYATDIDRGMEHNIWIGWRSDNTDSILCSMLLLALLGWAVYRSSSRSSKKQGSP